MSPHLLSFNISPLTKSSLSLSPSQPPPQSQAMLISPLINITTMASFIPALLIIDLQEDFCPPNGSLAVKQGRDVAIPINRLLTLPFSVKIATRDWHPSNHISFAANHPGAIPYESTYTITKPSTNENYTTVLWPTHCVNNTPGAEIIPELNIDLVDETVDKGMVQDREMYSAFYDPFGESDSGLAAKLKDAGVTHVYVTGLASDYCVKSSAEHSLAQRFVTYIVDDATRPVFPDKWPQQKVLLEKQGIQIISSTGPEIQRVENLSQ